MIPIALSLSVCSIGLSVYALLLAVRVHDRVLDLDVAVRRLEQSERER